MTTTKQPVEADKIVCHAKGDRCWGCPHYHGKASVCSDAYPDTEEEVQMTLQRRVAQLRKIHGGFRTAARAIDLDPAYLFRLGNGEKTKPSKAVLRRMGLIKIVTYVLARKCK